MKSRCLIRNINLPKTMLKPTKSVRVEDPEEVKAIMRAAEAKKEEKAQETSGKKNRPRIRTHFTKEVKEQAIKMWNEGKRVRDISAELGINEKALLNKYHQLQEQGVIEKRSKVSNEKKMAIRAAIREGKSNKRIAEEIGASATTVARYRKKMGETGK